MTYIVRPLHRAARAGRAASRQHFSRGGAQLLVYSARFVFRWRANEGALLHSGHIVRIGTVVIATGQLLLVELEQHAVGHRPFGQELLFFFGAIDPKNMIRSDQGADLLDPGAQGFICGRVRAKLLFVHSGPGASPSALRFWQGALNSQPGPARSPRTPSPSTLGIKCLNLNRQCAFRRAVKKRRRMGVVSRKHFVSGAISWRCMISNFFPPSAIAGAYQDARPGKSGSGYSPLHVSPEDLILPAA